MMGRGIADAARAAYPNRVRAQSHFERGAKIEAGDWGPMMATGSDAENAGRVWMQAQLARPAVSEADRTWIALRLQSPHRAPTGSIVAAQADPGHLPLFVAAAEPGLGL